MGGKGTFDPGTARNPTGVGELDGVWAVERGSGALPPLLGCVKRIDEAHAMEQNVLRMLDGMIATTDDPEILDALEHHKMQTQGHAGRMAQRLEAHGAMPSTVRHLGGVLGALAKMPLDFVRGENAGRNARDGYAAEHMEIASYELLSRIAKKAGDEETATAAREIIEEERAMARVIELNWDKFAELSLQEEGIT